MVCECLQKTIFSGRGFASIICPLYLGPLCAARWSVSVGPVYIMFVYIMFVLVNLPFVSVVALKTLF